jgi:hypothetical protein
MFEHTKRYYHVSTFFALPESCLFADLIEFYDKKSAVLKESGTTISYTSMFQDIRSAMGLFSSFFIFYFFIVLFLIYYIRFVLIYLCSSLYIYRFCAFARLIKGN